MASVVLGRALLFLVFAMVVEGGVSVVLGRALLLELWRVYVLSFLIIMR